jgi:hypothetical protein
MEPITVIVTFLFRLLKTVLSKLVADEIIVLLPLLTDTIVKFAASRVPPYRRERCEEEWASHIADIPGQLRRLLEALGFVRVGYAVAITEWTLSKTTSVWAELENINCMTDELAMELLEEKLAAADEGVFRKATQLRQHVSQSRDLARQAVVAVDEMRCVASDGIYASVFLVVADWTRLRKQRDELRRQMGIRAAAVSEVRTELERLRQSEKRPVDLAVRLAEW